jgi:hypothetical protein
MKRVDSPQDGAEGSADQPSRCLSCGQPLAGPFCSACGEETHETHDLSIRHFITHSVLHEFTHIDGKIVRTLRGLLFRPGFLTCEYFAGRRGPYVTPLRLLLTAAILFALIAPPTRDSLTVGLGRPHPFLQLHLSMLPPSTSEKASIEENIKKLDVANVLTEEWQAIQRRHPEISGDVAAERFNRYIEGYCEILSFCSVVPLALLTWLIYGRRRRYLVEHLVFALHLEAFLLFLGIAVNTLSAPPVDNFPRVLQMAFLLSTFAITYIAQAWYLQNSLIRFFEPDSFERRYSIRRLVAWKTAFVAGILFFANSLFLSIVHTIGAAIALWRL